ncbi:Nuclear control of ATP synthase [Parasponia andersonii]|uniref:Nuclear control of ATP synthase n=1 Tax=Parasponia andersonii TaxID=3476 RepID=A0A2P5DLC3_PARAD|nr:Nuclear control of ATP synthase [Parasponia andersonii]
MEDLSPPAPGEENQSTDFNTLFSFYSNFLRNRAFTFLSSPASNFLGKISHLYRQGARARSRRRCPRLPLPLPSKALDSSLVKTEASRVVDVLEDILEHIYSNLDNIQTNLQFWKSRAEGSNAQKAYFMLFERGPRALFDGTIQLIRESVTEGSGVQHLCHSASVHVSERIDILTSLQCCLATFLAQVYVEADRLGEELINDPDNVLVSLLVTVNALLSKLEASIGHLDATHQINSSIDASSFPLQFEKLAEVNQERSQWTDCEIKNAIKLVLKYQKPRKITRYWIRYTCGAVGLSVCSMWLIKHSSLMGSSDINNWIREAKDSTVSFFSDHVEQPLLSIRDELFETFRKRHKGMMDLEEVQLTSNSLHRMLIAFSEQVKGKNFPENASDQEMLEIVMARYEKELMHPIQNLLSGELARALLIQVQKLKLDIETAMLELNQILRANEINFAILAALPAFFLSLLLLMLVRAWYTQDTRTEGRGRISRIRRRLLVVEVEKRIMLYQNYLDQGLENDAQCTLGLLLYSVDRLYRAVERHAKASGEWQCVKQDILDLAKPALQTEYKLIVTSRMGRMYECLLPSLKRQ